MLNNKSVLITGGTGSFGKKFIDIVINRYPKIKRLVIFSRDELKQHEMRLSYSKKENEILRFFIGDVRDKDRLMLALENIDYVVHAAALKQVPAAEYNPFEFIKTNIIGSNNLIECCINKGVKKVISLSTDKAAAPVNLYGATKLCADKLFVAANNIVGKKKITFSVVRYGNVFGSRGSVIPIFLNKKKNQPFKITDPRMTRFNISLEEGVNFVLDSLKISSGKEIFVPKLYSYNIMDIADAIDKNSRKVFTGLRAGEKLHEEMITYSDSFNTFESKNFYVILPNTEDHNKIVKKLKLKKTKKNFSYNSENNKKLKISDIKLMLKTYHRIIK